MRNVKRGKMQKLLNKTSNTKAKHQRKTDGGEHKNERKTKKRVKNEAVEDCEREEVKNEGKN